MSNTTYPTLSANAMAVLERRYLAKDRDGNTIEDPDGMFRRVAHNLSQAELRYGATNDQRQAVEDDFFRLMRSLEFLPNSPTLMNAGRELQQLSACFVLPVEDSLDAIFTQVKQTALIHKSGGGTGFSFSRLRPAGDVVGSTGGVASGPVSFINAFDAATDVVKQGGTRRGANMAILHVTHPDIMEFIRAKEDSRRWTNFNISVALTDAFMHAVESGDDYDLVNPRTGEATGRLSALEVWRAICSEAHLTGDPGVIFIDEVNRTNPNPHVGQIEATNPCGEQPLLPYESCTLGSLNLAAFYEAGFQTDPEWLRSHGVLSGEWQGIDWGRLQMATRIGVRMLDNVVDMNRYPIPEILHQSQETRRIGLGVMGWADLLVQMGIRYDSDEALELAESLMSFVRQAAHWGSIDLGVVRGEYPAYLWHPEAQPVALGTMRNTAPTTIAPTGTISIIAGVSSGIEPLFALAYVRDVMDGTRMVELNADFERAGHYGRWMTDDIADRLAAGETLAQLTGVPKPIKEIYRTAHDIDPEWHVRMQAAFQRHTDNAVSKTINLPADATAAQVANAYWLAWKLHCKGATVYRDGSKDGQVLTPGLFGRDCVSCEDISEVGR